MGLTRCYNTEVFFTFIHQAEQSSPYFDLNMESKQIWASWLKYVMLSVWEGNCALTAGLTRSTGKSSPLLGLWLTWDDCLDNVISSDSVANIKYCVNTVMQSQGITAYVVWSFMFSLPSAWTVDTMAAFFFSGPGLARAIEKERTQCLSSFIGALFEYF